MSHDLQHQIEHNIHHMAKGSKVTIGNLKKMSLLSELIEKCNSGVEDGGGGCSMKKTQKDVEMKRL